MWKITRTNPSNPLQFSLEKELAPTLSLSIRTIGDIYVVCIFGDLVEQGFGDLDHAKQYAERHAKLLLEEALKALKTPGE